MLHKYTVELSRIAESYGVETAALMAIIEVESSGQIFTEINGRNYPLIRWEGHYFDRLVPVSKREEARKAGLAHPIPGTIKNPKSQLNRYQMLRRALKIDEDAALQSISIGVGQVMGAHWKILGYRSPREMFNRALDGFEGQVELMLRYIDHFDLLDELQRLDWSGFARGYNGPSYRKNKYDSRMAAAYRKYSGAETPPSPASGMLRMGSTGARVREVQQLLVRAGMSLTVDGDFGPATKQAVMEFQTLKGITVDGVVGPETMAALNQYRVTPDENVGKTKLTDIEEVKAGLGAVLGGSGVATTVQQAADKIGDVAGDMALFQMISAGLTTVAALLIVGGLAYSLWGWLKSGKTFEGLT